jgi:hypothetical protein
MKASNKTTVRATVVGAALGVIAVFVENKFGAGITAEVAAAETTLFTAVFGTFLPL